MSRIQAIPYGIPFVLRYVTCSRFDRRYPHTYFNLVTDKSLYSFRNTRSRDLHSHISCKACVWCCITEWAPRYLSVTRSDKSQSWSMLTQGTPSEIPVEHLYSHPVMLRRLMHTRYSFGASELYDLMVIGTNTWHAENNSNKTTRSICYVHSLGLVHHMILLVMWSRYQVTTLAYGQKTLTIFDQRASQLEAY